MALPTVLGILAWREPYENMPLPNKAPDQGYSAVFAAQKKSRGAYGKKHLVDATNYKELSVQNYAALTAERLQREKGKKKGGTIRAPPSSAAGHGGCGGESDVRTDPTNASGTYSTPVMELSRALWQTPATEAIVEVFAILLLVSRKVELNSYGCSRRDVPYFTHEG